ncbi:flagella synthesis protein FlgN [Legionella hackeliae]|uniref:Putative flagella synthesis protein FlgN n=1 Tax=Legionella hackeliae TaxID=449 RepID=A0A0A8USE8_LEGHA|nr:flagellar protein FlgN [Legionella hackeliae]KTD13757.1 flagellar biosynthesis/type III secretory pathway chaperone [Legionella hackeliae]CEK10456.1 Putative flagella synthesis protein FlgN [Legionella hackeliae]STX47192.1 flagella synthesis protein FlgN [Legionella hackeliae]
MTDAKPATLIHILEQEINFIEKLITLLTEEKNALIARQFEMLESFATQKQELSNQLEQTTKQRVDLLGLDLQTKPAKKALEDFLMHCSIQETEKINSLNKILAEKLILCRELNTVNGQVITSNINTRQEIINALTGQSAESTASIYTATGNLKISNDPNSHQKA